MDQAKLSALLRAELLARNWSIPMLAKEAGVSYESARRAVNALGSIELETTNKLLVAVGKQLTVQPVEGVA